MSDSDLFDTWSQLYAKKCLDWEDRSLNYESGKLKYTYQTMQREIDFGLSLKGDCDKLMRQCDQSDFKGWFHGIQNDITKTIDRLKRLRDSCIQGGGGGLMIVRDKAVMGTGNPYMVLALSN